MSARRPQAEIPRHYTLTERAQTRRRKRPSRGLLRGFARLIYNSLAMIAPFPDIDFTLPSTLRANLFGD